MTENYNDDKTIRGQVILSPNQWLTLEKKKKKKKNLTQFLFFCWNYYPVTKSLEQDEQV